MISKNKKRVVIGICIITSIFLLSLNGLVNASTEERLTEPTITINLEYKTGTEYDTDNDGIEAIKGIVDLTVENTDFNYAIDKNKLCTLWETYSFDSGEITTVCYGSEQCCNSVNLIPSRGDWDAIFYSNYGRYGATFNNIISAKVIHREYDLSKETPYDDIRYSDWSNLSIKYINIIEELGTGQLGLGDNLDITISTPPSFVIKKNQFDVLIILTNYGKSTLDNIPINIMFNPCLTTNDKLERTISNLEAGKNKIIKLLITKKEECSSKDYMTVSSVDKFIFKTI